MYLRRLSWDLCVIWRWSPALGLNFVDAGVDLVLSTLDVVGGLFRVLRSVRYVSCVWLRRREGKRSSKAKKRGENGVCVP